MSNIKAKVIDTQVTSREGITKSGPNVGTPYKRTNQDNVFVELDGEVRRLPLDIPAGVSPYAPGNYSIDLTKLITIGRFGFEMKQFAEVKLIPVTVSAAIPQQQKG